MKLFLLYASAQYIVVNVVDMIVPVYVIHSRSNFHKPLWALKSKGS